MKTASQLAILVLASFNVSAATHYVSLESPSPTPPYTNWATAAHVIQDAVDLARSGDTVLVTNGVYAVGGITNEWGYVANRVTITNAIRLESVNGPLVTTIDGGSTERCVYLGNNAILSGFTITNGVGHGGFKFSGRGGGILSEPSGVVTNCTLAGNIVEAGSTADGIMPGNGGGIFGGTVYNCTITGNNGGGAYRSTLYNCTLTGNSANYEWFNDGSGAALSTLYNCTVMGNYGGGAAGSTLYNCTVVENKGGGVKSFSSLSSTVFNSIVYYNSGGNYDENTALNFCCTTPLPTNGVGNITGPPLFMDFIAGDFRLREESPCIDAGTNLVGFTPTVTNEWGEVSVLTYTHDPTDMLGNTRFIDGNFDGIVAWDIGAYEFNSYPPPRFTCTPQRMPDCWRLSISGAPNQRVRVQRSSDLKNWEDWWTNPNYHTFFEIVVFMGSAGVKQVDDYDTGQTMMFYRVVVE